MIIQQFNIYVECVISRRKVHANINTNVKDVSYAICELVYITGRETLKR
jgi:hypothetical protein